MLRYTEKDEQHSQSPDARTSAATETDDTIEDARKIDSFKAIRR